MSACIKEILDRLDLRASECVYCDVRIEESVKTLIIFRNFELQSCDLKPSLGAFVRVFNNGKWFYCSTTSLDKLSQTIKDLIRQSIKSGHTPFKIGPDPFSQIKPLKAELIKYPENSAVRVPIKEKLELCKSFFDTIRKFPVIKENHVLYADSYKVKWFKSSKAVEYHYDYNLHGIMVSYTLKDGDRIFRDSFTEASDTIQTLKSLPSKLKEKIEESSLFLDAKTVPPGRYRVVLGSEVVGVFAHESFGHKSEADFMLGDENAKKEWKLGMKVGADILTIADDGGRAGTSGYCPFDDEGTPAQKTYLIKNGVLSGRLHDRVTSHALNEAPTGNGRAVSFEFEPIVRMTSTYVEPGALSFDEMISKIELGIFIKDSKHGSGLSTFTIAPKKCYWIRNGRLAEPVRVSVISGTVFQTLKDIEAVSKDFKLFSSGFGGCGKMEQAPLPVAFGGPAITVRKMQVS